MNTEEVCDLEFIAIGCNEILLPIPKRLSVNEIISGAGVLSEKSFPSKSGKAMFRKYAKKGYKLLSWHDGTRLAYRKNGGKNLTRDEGVYLYSIVRDMIEKNINDLNENTISV